MIVVKIMGGLGNQMFQIAYARHISLETHQDIYIDNSLYKKYKIRNFSLDNLQISNKTKKIQEAKLKNIQIILYRVSSYVYRIFQKIYKLICKTDVIGYKIFHFLSLKGLYYNFDRYYYDISISKDENKFLYGYFQSEEYFKKNREIIINELHVKTPLTDKEIEVLSLITNSNSIAISMRLGDDYIKSKGLNVCTVDFYKSAIEIMNRKFPNARYFVFSDCIEKAKEIELNTPNIYYVEGFNDYESLRLMYSCNHFIISNSSFSWWGSYLAKNDDKTIIAPNIWYTDSKTRPSIYYTSMHLIDVQRRA